jgi:hypothetical protein
MSGMVENRNLMHRLPTRQLDSMNASCGSSIVSFKYDPFGRRIYKSSSSATSVYAYDGDNLVEETSATGISRALQSLRRFSKELNKPRAR